jgi:hypothetical protein
MPTVADILQNHGSNFELDIPIFVYSASYSLFMARSTSSSVESTASPSKSPGKSRTKRARALDHGNCCSYFLCH